MERPRAAIWSANSSVVQGTVWPSVVVFLPPILQLLSGIVHVPEPVCIQALVAQSSVEAFHLSVLHWFARLYVEQLDLFLLAPGKKVP